MTALEFRSLWLELGAISRAFLLFFGAVCVYTLYVMLSALLTIRSLKSQRTNQNTNDTKTRIGLAGKRFANLRQLHLFTLYVFGLCIAIAIPDAFNTLGHSSIPPIVIIMRQLGVHFYFDRAILLGFLFIHILQWIVSSRLNSFVMVNAE